MANRRPTPLKDEPAVPLDELQELLAANLDAMEKLRKILLVRSDTNQPEMAEAIAAATTAAAQLRAGGEGSHRTRQTHAAGVLFKVSGRLYCHA